MNIIKRFNKLNIPIKIGMVLYTILIMIVGLFDPNYTFTLILLFLILIFSILGGIIEYITYRR